MHLRRIARGFNDTGVSLGAALGALQMQLLGELSAIWRFPVKSLAAQALDATRIEPEGIPEDRTFALFVESQHARMGKTYRGKEHNLLHTTGEPQAAVALAANRGIAASLRASQGERYFDAAPISLILDSWIDEVSEALGIALDPRRWRPNLYVRASRDQAFTESNLVERSIEIGEAILRVRCPIARCVAITYDVETGEPNDEILRYLAQHRESVLGIYCDVESAGMARLGDPVRLRAR